MPVDLAPGLTVQVAPPVMPEVRIAPPSSTTVVVPVAGPPGPPGPAGSGAAGQVRLTALAAVALSGHRAVTPRPDGGLEYADNTTLAHLHAPVWITLGAAVAGDEVEVLAYGTLAEPSWSWIPGTPLYLGASGVITQVPPAAPALFLAQIGVATSPTTAFIDRQPSITLIT